MFVIFVCFVFEVCVEASEGRVVALSLPPPFTHTTNNKQNNKTTKTPTVDGPHVAAVVERHVEKVGLLGVQGPVFRLQEEFVQQLLGLVAPRVRDVGRVVPVEEAPLAGAGLEAVLQHAARVRRRRVFFLFVLCVWLVVGSGRGGMMFRH